MFVSNNDVTVPESLRHVWEILTKLIALSFERVEAAKSRDIGEHPAVSRKVRKTKLAVIVVREWLESILERSVNTRSAIREIQGTSLFVFPARRNSGRNKEVQG
jgi:hypothetical protein